MRKPEMAKTPQDLEGFPGGVALRGDGRSQRKKHILGQGQKVDLGRVWSSVDGGETHGESAA